ncbi:MAG: methyltransferase [Verrucomicrobiaceae bacterium]|nr:methyltransferase [Verrucomicrobiaceae bacterium]
MNLTARPATDPLTLYRYRDGLYAVDLLTALIVGFDFFTWLGDRAVGEGEIADHFGFARRPLDVALTLLAANGLIVRSSDGVRATDLAQEHLSTSSGWCLTPYYASLHDRPIARDYMEVLRTGKPAGWSGDKSSGDWHTAMEDEGFARKFTSAMDCRGRYLAQALAKGLDLQGRTRVLDIGGGSGIYACSLVAQNEGLQGCVLEQAPVDRVCSKLVAERGFADRVSIVTGNMFDGMPTDCDVHLFSNVLHDWDEAEALVLMQKSAAALPAGGLLVIHDAFINQHKDGPLHVAEYSCLLMHSTQGKCYSTTEYSAMMRECGLEPGAYADTVVGRGFLVAKKP